MNILIKGYYGRSNLGDDLLMISTYSIIKNKYPNADIYINSEQEYIYDLLPNLKFLKNQSKIDLTVLGGGGVYFDFKKGNFKFLLQNYLSKLFGLSFVFKIIRLFKNTNNLTIAIGIGVGSYTTSSNRFLKQMYSIYNLKYICVRDFKSYQRVKHINKNVHLFSDLVFDINLWINIFREKLNKIEKKDHKVLIIVRDWKSQKLDTEIDLYKKLISKGIKTDFMIFDKESDKKSLSLLKNKEIVPKIYNPFDISTSINYINTFSLIVTQRAHGAIIGNVLGIPSVCIGVEEKLKNVHKMIDNSSVYVDANFNTTRVSEIIKKELDTGILKKKCLTDNRKNINKNKGLIDLINKN